MSVGSVSTDQTVEAEVFAVEVRAVGVVRFTGYEVTSEFVRVMVEVAAFAIFVRSVEPPLSVRSPILHFVLLFGGRNDAPDWSSRKPMYQCLSFCCRI